MQRAHLKADWDAKQRRPVRVAGSSGSQEQVMNQIDNDKLGALVGKMLGDLGGTQPCILAV